MLSRHGRDEALREPTHLFQEHAVIVQATPRSEAREDPLVSRGAGSLEYRVVLGSRPLRRRNDRRREHRDERLQAQNATSTRRFSLR